MIYLHVALCVGLVYLGYWRIVRSTAETHRSVRLSLSFLTTASVAMGLAPFAWGQPISGALIFLESALLFHQATTAKLWSAGPPSALQRDTLP